MAKLNVCKAIQEHLERQELPPHGLEVQEKLLRALDAPRAQDHFSPAEEESKPKPTPTTGGNCCVTEVTFCKKCLVELINNNNNNIKSTGPIARGVNELL